LVIKHKKIGWYFQYKHPFVFVSFGNKTQKDWMEFSMQNIQFFESYCFKKYNYINYVVGMSMIFTSAKWQRDLLQSQMMCGMPIQCSKTILYYYPNEKSFYPTNIGQELLSGYQPKWLLLLLHMDILSLAIELENLVFLVEMNPKP